MPVTAASILSTPMALEDYGGGGIGGTLLLNQKAAVQGTHHAEGNLKKIKLLKLQFYSSCAFRRSFGNVKVCNVCVCVRKMATLVHLSEV